MSGGPKRGDEQRLDALVVESGAAGTGCWYGESPDLAGGGTEAAAFARAARSQQVRARMTAQAGVSGSP
ncbi:hypothetical protein [Actinoallomurus iriomotensis]|uniref:Uncharacterized protein n=1 Tax=Actinoallomurus iriomotensis TaxID=478107 RepID=A0A9W6VM77_9ACTN|nr:hypothetical protein [Actinoallomurus iriomotensis]GLY73430.1 hypothetical protein Airi01_016970 [Actinoallomurus iriomotensis]